MPYIWAHQVRRSTGNHQVQLGSGELFTSTAYFAHVIYMQKAISKFHESVRKRQKRLHVMVVDECHYAATLGQAHDAFVNEFKWQNADGVEVWGPCKGSECTRHPTAGAILNMTLLVSATPYCVLSQQSRIPKDQLQVSAERPAVTHLNVM